MFDRNRKFKLSILALIIVSLSGLIGLTDSAIYVIGYIVLAYVIGEAFVDRKIKPFMAGLFSLSQKKPEKPPTNININ